MNDSDIKSCCAALYELPITTVLLGPSFHPGGPALTRKLASLALVNRDSRVLDVASGTGETARTLAHHFGCEVVGVDLSELNTARARAQTPEGARVTFSVGDAEQLPFEDGTFDVVFCECALCTFPNMGSALSEMRRVLAPRGRLAMSDMVINAPIPEELDHIMSHVLCIRGALSEEGYVSALTEAGFDRIRPRGAGEALLDMLAQVERRIPVARRLAEAGELELPSPFEDPTPTLVAARAFISARSASYTLFTAVSP